MTNKALTAEILQLKDTVAELQSEMRLLRLRGGRTDEVSLESLLAHIHDACGSAPWTSNRLFEQGEDNRLLYGALVRCLGPQPTIQALSKLAMRHRGRYGNYFLKCVKERGRLGAVFTVTQCVTASQMEESTVTRTTGRRS